MILGYQTKERTENENKVGKNKQFSYLSTHAYHIKWLLGSPIDEMLGVNANKAECLLIYHRINHWLCPKFCGSIVFLFLMLVFRIRDTVNQ